MDESLRSRIADLVAKNHVVLFMKGNRKMPACGFSAQVVKILDELVPSYETVDVLASSEMRDGIKEFSRWPTIPQLYVDGKFVGGCDIVREMHATGDLQNLVGANAPDLEPPAITMSASAAAALRAAAIDAGGDALHLSIDADFHYDLFFGARQAGEIDISTNGLSILLDRPSASRANGLSIEFVEGPGGGFKIDNPNEPPKVKQLSATEVKAMLDRQEITLFDVRSERERAIASISAARSLDAAGQAFLISLDRDTPIAMYCHHGGRSQAAAEQLVREGFKKVYNLEGGIDAWSATVDPSVPRY